MKSIREETERIVREAGKLFSKEKLDESEIVKKGFANFVTAVDYAVQEYIVKELHNMLPDSNVISEESDKNIYKLDRPTWVLDPVDGTTNFMYGYRHSAISLALFIEKKPVLGFVYNPDTNEMFAAEAGKGTFLNGRKIETSKNGSLEDSLVAFGTTPYDRSKAGDTFWLVQKIYEKCRDVRRSGAAALDLAYVACGRLEGFFELRLQPWDYAAGMLIVREAGGMATNWQGQCLEDLKPNSVLASNGLIHKELLSIVSQVGK